MPIDSAASPAPSPTVLTTNRSGWVWTGLVALVGLLAAVDCARRGYWGLGVSVLVWTVFLAWFIAVVFVLPRLSIDGTGVNVRNVLVGVRIPWARLADARSTLFLELTDDAGASTKVWAAPVSAASRGRAAVRQRMRSSDEESARGGDLAAGLIQERDRALASASGMARPDDGGAPHAPGSPEPVRRRFLGREWSVVGLLLVLALASLLFA